MQIWALILALLMFSSCSNDVPEEKTSDSARLSSFVIGKIEGKADEAVSYEKEFWSEYKNSRIFNLKTCITVKGSNVDLPDVKFSVSNMGIPVNEILPTDNKGCLSWSFKYSFDYLVDETFYEIPITIEGASHYEGKLTATVAINPWSGEIIDLEYDRTSHQILPFDGSNSTSLSHSLLVNGLKFQQTEKKARKIGDGQFWELYYNLEFKTFLNRMDLDKKIIEESISKGKYNVQLQVVEKDAQDGSTHIISKGEVLIDGKNGIVQTIVPMLHNTARFRNTQNETVLKFTLIPDRNAPAAIKSLEGSIPMEGISHAKTDVLDLVDIKSVNTGLENTQRYEQQLEQLTGGTVDRNGESDNGMQLKLSHLDFVDHGNVNSITSEDPQQKFRRFEIIGKLFNPLSLRQAEAIVDGEFDLSVQSNDELINAKNQVQSLTLEPDGSFHAFVAIAYNLYEREKNFALTFTIKCLSGNWEGAKVSQDVKFNPWLKKGYEANEAPEIHEVQNPQLITESITFHSPYADTNSYLINRNMNLGYNAVYTLETPLKFLRFKSEGEEEMLNDVLTGEYDVEILLFAPKKAEVDYENINFSDYFFLTGSRRTIKINPTGLLQAEMKFPFLVSERPYINFKNLAVVTFRPIKNESLRPVTMTMPFFGRAKKATYIPRLLPGGVPDYIYNDYSQGVLTQGNNFKINSVTKDNNLSNLEVYRSMLDQEKLTTLSINSFNKRFIDIDESKIKDYKITPVDLMRFDQLDHTRVVKILKKFCHFHHLSLHSSKTNRDGLASCLDDPKLYFKATPTFHIKSLEDYKTHEYQVNGIAKATYIGKDMGQLNRGRSYFAGTGVSRYHWKGEMTTDSYEISKSVGYESRVPLFINVKASEARTISVFDRNAEGQNQMNAYRSFTTLVKDAEYEKLTLQFSANVIKCIKVYNDDIIYHVCDTLDRPYSIKENWYFIGTPLESDEGVIVDGNFRPQDNLTQLIRGNYNLMRQWDSYLKVDNSYIIKYNHDIDISEGLLKFQEDERFEKVPMGNRIDNSYPGLFIPCELEIESKR